MLPLISGCGGHACIFIKIIFLILALVINKQILFFVDQRQDLFFTVLKFRSQLNGGSGAGLRTQTTINAPGEINAKPYSIAPTVFFFSRLHGDAAYRANRRTQITGHATFSAIRIPRQNDARPAACRQRALVFRILFRNRLSKEMPESCGKANRERLNCI